MSGDGIVAPSCAIDEQMFQLLSFSIAGSTGSAYEDWVLGMWSLVSLGPTLWTNAAASSTSIPTTSSLMCRLFCSGVRDSRRAICKDKTPNMATDKSCKGGAIGVEGEIVTGMGAGAGGRGGQPKVHMGQRVWKKRVGPWREWLQRRGDLALLLSAM